MQNVGKGDKLTRLQESLAPFSRHCTEEKAEGECDAVDGRCAAPAKMVVNLVLPRTKMNGREKDDLTFVERLITTTSYMNFYDQVSSSIIICTG